MFSYLFLQKKKKHFKIYISRKPVLQYPTITDRFCSAGEEKHSEQTGRDRSKRGILCEILPKVYGRLKGLKAWRKLDQGESSPNFHYFQVV